MLKLFKRFRRRLLTTTLVLLAFCLIVGTMFWRAHIAVREEAQALLDHEMLSIGQAVTSAFDVHASRVIKMVQDLGLDRAEGCSPRFHSIGRFMVGSVEHLQDVGLVKADGTLECSVLRPANPVQGFLKLWTLNDPPLTLAVLEDVELQRRPVVLVINKGLNNRIIIRFAPSVLPTDMGISVIQAHLSYDAMLTSGERWLHWEGSRRYAMTISPIADLLMSVSDLPRRFEKTVNSHSFPILISVQADTGALVAIYARLESGAIRVQLISAVVVLGLLVVIAWRSRAARSELDYSAVFDQGEFIPHYQPVVDLNDGQIVGCEVLLRFLSHDGKLIQPNSFITYAETTGLIMEITHELMIKVAEEMDDLSKDFPDLKVSINLTGKHFEDMSIVDDIRIIFEDTNTSFEQLVFELTERYPVEDFDIARMVISGIQNLGSSVALDDAGTGHGGFSYLQKLGIDIIKIDKMFVDTFNRDVTTMAIVDTIVDLAKNLDMGIVAEGVESSDQVQRLRSLGISAAQGYFFAPALPASVYCDLVRSSRKNNSGFDAFVDTKVVSQIEDITSNDHDEEATEDSDLRGGKRVRNDGFAKAS
ncbi:MAG: EAL domain-containing protein [Rhizobiales bacterium]|nr:EAL domain-containing protein [Hyphomicrobiales bacterium]